MLRIPSSIQVFCVQFVEWNEKKDRKAHTEACTQCAWCTQIVIKQATKPNQTNRWWISRKRAYFSCVYLFRVIFMQPAIRMLLFAFVFFRSIDCKANALVSAGTLCGFSFMWYTIQIRISKLFNGCFSPQSNGCFTAATATCAIVVVVVDQMCWER